MLSIITPTKNISSDPQRLLYFNKMIDSIKNQTFSDFEHILVDLNSDNKTLNLLEKIKTNYNCKVISKKDSGVYQAMNRGITNTSGKYVLIINSDDYFTDNNFLFESIEYLENNPDISFTHANKTIKSRKGISDKVKIGNEKEAFYRMPFRHNTMIIKRKVFENIGLFDENLKIASDYKFIINMLLEGYNGYHFNKIVMNSLDGGVSSNRELCIEEVSKILYDSYGKNYGLSLEECKNIYLRNFNLKFLFHILKRIKNNKIRASLINGFLGELKSKIT